MRVTTRAASLAACNVGLLCGAVLLAGCGASSSVHVSPPANTASVIGSVVPGSSYELDAFDIQGNYAYILGDKGNQGSGSSAAQFFVVDITHPTSMAVVSATSITGFINYGQSGIRAQGQYVYLVSSTGTASTNLLQIYDLSNPYAPAFAGSVQVPLYGIGLWVSGEYAYVISYVGDSFASTLEVVDVSNPASPTIVGSTDTGTAGLHVADIKVVGNYAYVAGQSGGQSELLVFDIANPALPYLLSSLPVAHSPQGLDVEGSYLYETIYDGNSLNIYDISNPSSLSQVGTASLIGTCKPQDVTVEGSTAYVACYTNSSVAVVDVSHPTSPSVNGYISLPAASSPIFLKSKGRYVYSISNTLGGMLSVIDTGGA
jgi:hypothetical protein